MEIPHSEDWWFSKKNMIQDIALRFRLCIFMVNQNVCVSNLAGF